MNNSLVQDPNEFFLSIYLNWYTNNNNLQGSYLVGPNTTAFEPDFVENFTPAADGSNANRLANCTLFYTGVRTNYESIIKLINIVTYFIITVGILFNILNLVVLLKTKLNESPYTYLTVLALSDLGALLILALEKVRQTMIDKNSEFIENSFIFIITPLLNIFLSCSMYVTLALTIERFIFIHSPFRAIAVCHKSVARRVCLFMFIFSVLRSIYLPFMYVKSECVPDAWTQRKLKGIDIYEFLVSLAIPYSIIFVTNISLIVSLNKQNDLMRTSTFSGSSRRVTTKENTGEQDTPKLDSIKKHSVRRNSSQTTKRVNLENNMFYRTFNKRELRNQKKLTVSLIIILCSLLICYFPSFLFEESLADVIFGEIKFDLSEESARLLKIKGIGYRVSLVFIYVNCSCNFLIYCISNKKFKNSFLLLIKRTCILKKQNKFEYKSNSIQLVHRNRQQIV